MRCSLLVLIPILALAAAPPAEAQELVLTPDPLVIFIGESGDMLISPSPPATQTIVIDLDYSNSTVANGPLTFTIPLGTPHDSIFIQAIGEGMCTITAMAAGYDDGVGNVVVISQIIFSDDFESGDTTRWS